MDFAREEQNFLDKNGQVCYDITRVQETAPSEWRDVRVVEGTGLENRRRASARGFESHSLRQTHQNFIRIRGSTQVAEGAPLLRE